MRKLLLGFIFLLIIVTLLGALFGCTDNKVKQSPDGGEKDIQEFESIFIDFAKVQNITLSSEEMDAFNDITPQNVFKETGCQIFKNGKTCESYLLCEGNLYTLGTGFGGLGIVDIVTCNFNDNGKKGLLYTYSWGSGIHRSSFGFFDLSKKCGEPVDISSAKSLGFIQEDLAFKKVSDTRFEVYTADVTIDDGDFTKLSVKKDKLFGEIKAVENKPVLFINSVTVDFKVDENKVPPQVQQDAARVILSKRLESMGVLGAQFTVNPEAFSIKIPLEKNQSVNDISDIINKITDVSYFTVQEVDEAKVDESGNYLPTGRIIIDSMDIVDSSAINSNNTPAIKIQLTDKAGQHFEEVTANNIGKPLAIFMDDNFVSAPSVEAKISGGAFVIHGFKNVEDAKFFVLLLLSGRLPYKLEIKDIR